MAEQANDLSRREMARVALGAAALAAAQPGRRGQAAARTAQPGHQDHSADSQRVRRRRSHLRQANRRRVRHDPHARRYLRSLFAVQAARRGGRAEGHQHRQLERPQHARGNPEPAGPRSENRRVQAVPARPGQGRYLLHHLCAHGQRHLEFRTRDHTRWSPGPRLQARNRQGLLGRQGLRAAADPRPQVQPGRAVGELQLLHQAGRAGGRRSRRPHRDSPRRPAGARAGRRAAPHLRNLRRLHQSVSRSPTAPTSASASAAAPGWKAARTPART